LSNEELQQSTTNKITGRFNSEVIVKYTGIDRALFDRFNPGFDQEIALNGTYQLRLPIRNMNDFIARRYQILEESLNLLLKNPTGTPR
jgi:membrane-bound lytic murein transglycosylase D